MKDERKPYKTKTFWGAVAYAILVVASAWGFNLPYETLFSGVTIWTGYSVAERLRSKK